VLIKSELVLLFRVTNLLVGKIKVTVQSTEM